MVSFKTSFSTVLIEIAEDYEDLMTVISLK